jgi:hypothetical protein
MSNGINIDLTANVARFSSSLDRATQDLNRFQTNTQRIGGSLTSIFAGLGVGLSVAGLTGLIKNSIDAADHLNDLSKTTGISVENLSGLQLAAKQSGTELEAVSSAVNKLAVNMGKDGEKFRQLGIDAKDPLEAFKQLSDIFVSIKDPQQRAALGAAALGKAWQDTAPLLSEGGQAIGDMVSKGRELSSMTTEFAAQSDQFNDQLEIMKAKLAGVGVSLAGPILSGFNQLIQKLDDATEHGITLNNVLNGLADFAFDQTTFTGVAGELQAVNKELDNVDKKIALMRNNSAIGGLIDDIAGNDINLELNKRDALIKKQEALFDKLQGAAPEKKTTPLAQGNVKKFLGIDQGEKASGASRIKQIVDETKQFDELISRMKRENELHDATTELVKVEYDIKTGVYKKATEGQREQILLLAKEKDAIEENAKSYQEFDAIVAEGTRLANEQKKDSEQQRINSSNIILGERKDQAKGDGSDPIKTLKDEFALRRQTIIENTTKEGKERGELLLGLETQYNKKRNKLYVGIAAEQTGIAADGFDQLSTLAANYYGEQSAEFKIAFAAYKAFAIANAIISTYQGAQQAFTAMAGIPYVGPVLGAVAAGAAVVAGLARVSAITSQSYSGAAHGGMDYIPKESTFLLDKGERVVSPRQNKDLTNFLQGQGNNTNNQNIVINLSFPGMKDTAEMRRSSNQIAQRSAQAAQMAVARNR